MNRRGGQDPTSSQRELLRGGEFEEIRLF
jgi:hypothetical protein